eukprot:TRINITY_DN68116_c1_g1_i1.p1 TRINITY_DN68116_c1_g1~~TRINITY_DN68116_c1_g1_i1.p1  ORF type:complete len:659 (+),score=100.44 TRINITY_DN68116_c1_g1_i1:67-2043(+)
MNLGIAEKEAGNQAFKDGDYAQAVQCYTDAIAVNPQAETYYSNRSAAYHKMNKFQSALSDADTCIKLKPDWPKGYYRRGEALSGLGLLSRASEAYSKALDLDPSDVTIRQALARAEKDAYAKAVQGGDDSDDELPMQPPPRRPSDSSFATTKRSEIINQRLAMGTGITSMEDYMRFKQAGGSNLPKGEDPLAQFVPEKTKNTSFQPTQSRAEFLSKLGISAEDSLSSSMMGGGGGGGGADMDDTYSSMQNRTMDTTAGGGGGGANSEELARKRAEFLASIGMSNNDTSVGGGGATGGGGSDWAKIRGSGGTTTSTATTATSVGDMYTSPTSISDYVSPTNSSGAPAVGPGGMSREDFIASLGLDSSEPPPVGSSAAGGGGGGGYARGSAINAARSRSITPPYEKARPVVPQAPLGSSAGGGGSDASREAFIASLGLDTRVPGEPPAASGGGPPSSGGSSAAARWGGGGGEERRQPAAKYADTEDSVDEYMRTRDITGGSPGGTSAYMMESRERDNTQQQQDEMRKSAAASMAASNVGKTVAGVQIKSAADYLASMGVKAKQEQSYDYAASGYVQGAGETINNGWLAEYRRKKQTGGSATTPDPTGAKELQQNYEGFQYRHFKEGAGNTLDETSKQSIIQDAILAESLRGYDYSSSLTH